MSELDAILKSIEEEEILDALIQKGYSPEQAEAMIIGHLEKAIHQKDVPDMNQDTSYAEAEEASGDLPLYEEEVNYTTWDGEKDIDAERNVNAEMYNKSYDVIAYKCPRCSNEFAKSAEGGDYAVNYCPECGERFGEESVKHIRIAPKPHGVDPAWKNPSVKGDVNMHPQYMELGDERRIQIAPKPHGTDPEWDTKKSQEEGDISKDIAVQTGTEYDTGYSPQSWEDEGKNFYPASEGERSSFKDNDMHDYPQGPGRFFEMLEGNSGAWTSNYERDRNEIGKSQEDTEGEMTIGKSFEEYSEESDSQGEQNVTEQLAKSVVALSEQVNELQEQIATGGRQSKVSFQKSKAESIQKSQEAQDEVFGAALLGKF